MSRIRTGAQNRRRAAHAGASQWPRARRARRAARARARAHKYNARENCERVSRGAVERAMRDPRSGCRGSTGISISRRVTVRRDLIAAESPRRVMTRPRARSTRPARPPPPPPQASALQPPPSSPLLPPPPAPLPSPLVRLASSPPVRGAAQGLRTPPAARAAPRVPSAPPSSPGSR